MPPALPIHASRALDPEARVKQLNLRIRRILDTDGEKVEAETEIPFHFARGDRVKRLYVSEDQRRRLAAGELAIVGFGGPPTISCRVWPGSGCGSCGRRCSCSSRPVTTGADEVEEGYEGYEVPDGLLW